MKTIIYYITTILISLNCFSQTVDSNLTPFVGNWEWQNGSEIFKVQIFIDGENLKGHYELVEIGSGGIETIIYKSNKIINEEYGFLFGDAIYGNSKDGVLFYASIQDNVLLGNGFNSSKQGNLAFEIQNGGGLGSPITATWRVKKLQGMKGTDEPMDFSIPTDITLIKVN